MYVNKPVIMSLNLSIYILIRNKSNSNDDSYGIDDSNKNPAVENKKPTCLTFFTDTCLNERFEYTINATQSMAQQLQIKV